MKNKLLTLICICCMILSSCRQDAKMMNVEQSKSSEVSEVKEITNDINLVCKEKETTFYENNLYEDINVMDIFKIYHCKMVRHEIGDLIDIEINYPQISYDIDTASIINLNIYEKVINEDMIVWHDSRFNYYLDYEITFYSDKMISILFRGDNECYGVNYNLETGKEMEIGQYVSSDVIMELLKNEEEPFFKDILKKAIKEKNINDKLTNFFIWERGIGLIVWPLEEGGRDYIITYFNLDENEITWEL